MKKNLILLISIILLSSLAYGQQIAEVKSVTIKSKNLKQKRELLIYLPVGYNENKYTHYDVIYIFDAQNRMLFDYVHSILGFQDHGDKEFIIVGITSPYYEKTDYARNNDMLPAPRYTEPKEFYNGYSGNANNFLNFIEKEVISYINHHYRTLGNNIAIGHSLSASLVIYSILQKPNMFNDIIAISPNLAFDKGRLIEDLLQYDYSKIKPHGFLYTSMANEGIEYWKPWKPAYKKFRKYIKDSLDKVYEYTYAEFPKRNHWTTYPASVQTALKRYFEYYSKNKRYKLSNRKVKVHIKVKVPNENDSVYITGNQDNLANWDPDKLLMEKSSKYEREINIHIQLPAELKFTRGNWDTEAIVEQNEYFGNIAITSNKEKEYTYEITNWNDRMEY
ncbi:MAG: alpha/beta hydrolase-fold protein [Prolixibacteraceae bacterium]|jgi:predicted alpha/beta superfamily hydrolase|nr:alpha/beta hydrolase-fold protein [Prolixibacteraceae bacterium]